MNSKVLPGVLAFGSIIAVSLYQPSAEAFSWTETTATIHNGDAAGTSFTTYFLDGYIDGNLTPGLTSEAVFTLVNDYNGESSAMFDVELFNTSDSTIFSNTRVSGLGFNTDPELASASVSNNNGIAAVLGSNVPQRSTTGGQVDVCFTYGNSCTGGGGDGILLGQNSSFTTTLNFSTSNTLSSFSLDSFVTRYQSIDFVNGPTGESGVGVGKVPTPALLPGIIGMGIAAFRKKKKVEDTSENPETVTG